MARDSDTVIKEQLPFRNESASLDYPIADSTADELLHRRHISSFLVLFSSLKKLSFEFEQQQFRIHRPFDSLRPQDRVSSAIGHQCPVTTMPLLLDSWVRVSLDVRVPPTASVAAFAEDPATGNHAAAFAALPPLVHGRGTVRRGPRTLVTITSFAEALPDYSDPSLALANLRKPLLCYPVLAQPLKKGTSKLTEDELAAETAKVAAQVEKDAKGLAGFTPENPAGAG